MKRERLTTLIISGFALLNLFYAAKRWIAFFLLQGTNIGQVMLPRLTMGTATWNILIFGIAAGFSLRNALGAYSKLNKTFWYCFAAWAICTLVLSLIGFLMNQGSFLAIKALVNTITGVVLIVFAVWQHKGGNILW